MARAYIKSQRAFFSPARDLTVTVEDEDFIAITTIVPQIVRNNMMATILIRIGLGMLMPMAALAFVPPARTHHSHCVGAGSWTLHSASGDMDDDDFDPFLQSPHSFGTDDDNNPDDGFSSSSSGTFGFDIGSSMDTDIAAAANPVTDTDFDFDPLLSPHAYANGADEGPTTATQTTPDDVDVMDLEFDPLLSPHAYPNGADAGPTTVDDDTGLGTAPTQKLGILLIDHGSKRQASNEHIHNIAQMYENRLNSAASKNYDDNRGGMTIVRAAHMEICKPSIIDSLRSIIAVDQVTKVVCIPYFLSPGRHATEDIPNLIAEAKGELTEEGVDVDILLSNALGTHLDSMLGAVDVLVEQTLLCEGK